MESRQTDRLGRNCDRDVPFEGYPVQESLGVLGRKWALLVLRNIGFYGKQRFSEMLRFTPGLTPRVLIMRLRELEREGFIEVEERGANHSRWGLTRKGMDVLPLLVMLAEFGTRWYGDKGFADERPRSLGGVVWESSIKKIMRGNGQV
jgi:DNA-binding HxlR family transcriptional regulator